MSVSVIVRQVIHLDKKAMEEVFMYRLQELADGWYIAESSKPSQKGVMVLCHDTEPHPHSGNTWREAERELTDPAFRVHVAAATLLQVLRKG